jgi:hypothetical protein
MLPCLNIHWEYGVCYPVAKYVVVQPSSGEESDSDDELDEQEILLQQIAQRLSQVQCGALLFHPERRSMMLWIMDGPSRRREDPEDDWEPTMVLGHEFSLLPFLHPHGFPDHGTMHKLGSSDGTKLLLTPNCESMLSMQNMLFKLGFGPLPYFRR